MNTQECLNKSENICKRICGIKCISWTSIIAGALVAIGLSFLLNLFSTAIGLSIFSADSGGARMLTVGGILGFAIGIVAIMFFAGWIAGHFGRSHCATKCCGALYGLTTWCLALILMAMLAMPFSRFITSYTSYISHNTVVTTIAADADHTDKTPAVATVTTEATLDDFSKVAFVVFVMFFLGALASTCGGHVGVMCCKNKECCNGSCKCCN